MESIKLQKIIEFSLLEINDLARHLFPTNKHPRLALNRVIKGIGKLSSAQVSKLSGLVGIPIEELYRGTWKTKTNINNMVYTFSSDEFTAELDVKTWTTKLFHKKSLFHEEIIYSSSLSMKEYIDSLNLIIFNTIKNESNVNSY